MPTVAGVTEDKTSAPFISQMLVPPLEFLQNKSVLPSPLKSPRAAICQSVETVYVRVSSIAVSLTAQIVNAPVFTSRQSTVAGVESQVIFPFVSNYFSASKGSNGCCA